MAWWQNLTARTRKAESTQGNFPVQFELVPGRLSARVYLNDIDSRDGAVSCWTYITNGLWAHKQKELIFSLRRSLEEKANDFPHAPLQFFTDVYRFSEQGRLVDVGDISEMATASFLGHKGLLYISPASCHNIESLDAALTAILLTEEELAAVKEFGPTRVMVRLGKASRHYPCPPWSDRNRPGLSFASSMRESLLTKAPRLQMRGTRVRMENNLITLRLLPQLREHIQEQLDQIPLKTPLALLADLDSSAHGCLVWEPGQSQPFAITPPNSDGTRLCGCFMAFVPDHSENSGKLIEDGFVMLLTNASWEAVRRALATGEAVMIPATGEGMSFQLEWILTSYDNPIDGSSYRTEAGWETYVPDGPTISQDQRNGGFIDVKHIVLLTSQPALRVRVGVKPLTDYIQGIEEIVRNHFALLAPADGQDLMAQFEVWPGGKVDVRLASRPGIASEVLDELHTSLLALPTPTVNQDSIKFQVVFAIWGGWAGAAPGAARHSDG
jgi:hypothetical protein